MFNLRSINEVRIQTPCDTSVTYIQDDISSHDFNTAMVNVSISLARDLMADRLIRNIRVSITKKGYAKIKN